MKAKCKGYHARNTKPLISGWLQLFMQMCKIFFSFSRNIFLSETVHFHFSIIIESFKLYYFFWTSTTCDEYFAMRTQIISDASSCLKFANLDARDFWCAVSGFGHFFIVSGVLKKCLAPPQNSNAWPPNIHIWTTLSLFSRYVSTDGSKRRYHSSGVSVDVAGMEKTVVVLIH